MAGLTSTGFESKDLDTVLSEIEAEEKNALGQSLNVRPTSVFGVINGILATKITELWDVSNDVWSSQNPDTAVGTSLDQLCQITGVTRESAEQSTVVLSLSGTPSTPIPALRRVKHNATGTYWTNPASATIGAASAVDVDFVSEDYGEIEALAGTLTIIDTPVSGWSSVTNPLDASEGQDRETDAELRVRRAQLLVSTGKATVDAIRASILNLDNVLAAQVFENTTSLTDSNGLPPKSFEVVVDGGVSADLAQTIWDSKPAGISAYGTTTGNATDAIGGTRVMAWTPVTQKNVYVSLTAVTGSGYIGPTADFATSIVAFGAGLDIGDDVSRFAAIAASFVNGVEDITDFRMDFFSSPTATSNLAVAVRERARFDSSRIFVSLA